MNDTISRQAAIEALDGEIEITGKENAKAVLKYTQMVSDRIKALPPVQPEQRWIPVTERLPKPYEYCLWTTTDGRVIYHHCDGLFSNYIAWMPLPTAYERSEE